MLCFFRSPGNSAGAGSFFWFNGRALLVSPACSPGRNSPAFAQRIERLQICRGGVTFWPKISMDVGSCCRPPIRSTDLPFTRDYGRDVSGRKPIWGVILFFGQSELNLKGLSLGDYEPSKAASQS